MRTFLREFAALPAASLEQNSDALCALKVSPSLPRVRVVHAVCEHAGLRDRDMPAAWMHRTGWNRQGRVQRLRQLQGERLDTLPRVATCRVALQRVVLSPRVGPMLDDATAAAGAA